MRLVLILAPSLQVHPPYSVRSYRNTSNLAIGDTALVADNIRMEQTQRERKLKTESDYNTKLPDFDPNLGKRTNITFGEAKPDYRHKNEIYSTVDSTRVNEHPLGKSSTFISRGTAPQRLYRNNSQLEFGSTSLSESINFSQVSEREAKMQDSRFKKNKEFNEKLPTHDPTSHKKSKLVLGDEKIDYRHKTEIDSIVDPKRTNDTPLGKSSIPIACSKSIMSYHNESEVVLEDSPNDHADQLKTQKRLKATAEINSKLPDHDPAKGKIVNVKLGEDQIDYRRKTEIDSIPNPTINEKPIGIPSKRPQKQTGLASKEFLMKAKRIKTRQRSR